MDWHGNDESGFKKGAMELLLVLGKWLGGCIFGHRGSSAHHTVTLEHGKE